jgi:hypothetical protein
MGVRGLAKSIKETAGLQASNLQNKHVHVDFMAMFFGLIRDSCFRDLSNTIAKESRSTGIVTATEEPIDTSYIQHTAEGKRRAIEEHSQRKKHIASSPSVADDTAAPQWCKVRITVYPLKSLIDMHSYPLLTNLSHRRMVLLNA